jgi:hypothetical protein
MYGTPGGIVLIFGGDVRYSDLATRRFLPAYGFGLSGKKFAGEFRGAGDCEVWDALVVAVG